MSEEFFFTAILTFCAITIISAMGEYFRFLHKSIIAEKRDAMEGIKKRHKEGDLFISQAYDLMRDVQHELYGTDYSELENCLERWHGMLEQAQDKVYDAVKILKGEKEND